MDKPIITDFEKGYICALTCITKDHGMSRCIVDAYIAGINRNLTPDDLLSMGVDEYDVEIIREHWSEISYRFAQ